MGNARRAAWASCPLWVISGHSWVMGRRPLSAKANTDVRLTPSGIPGNAVAARSRASSIPLRRLVAACLLEPGGLSCRRGSIHLGPERAHLMKPNLIGGVLKKEATSRNPTPRRVLWMWTLVMGAFNFGMTPAIADEGGVSFWVPGFFGSLAAAPQVPGFSFTNILYYSQVSAGGNVAFAKQVPLGNINVNFNGNLNANVHGSAEPLYLAAPGYTFATPVLGGQANFLVAIPYGRIESSVDATIMGNLGLGGPGFTIGRSLTETVSGFGDLSRWLRCAGILASIIS